MFYSPLRYPGGKNKLAPFVAKICADNNIGEHYVEPFAGGASVALFLLFEGFVKRVSINDKDRSIYALWHSVLNETDTLCDLIDQTEINLENWRRFRKIQFEKEAVSLIELGFSTLFLNRTNRSGIIMGGPIGGVNQEESKYKIDCRFNKEDIKRRIRLIAERKSDIDLYHEDALDLIDIIERKSIGEKSIIYFDPPYYLKGSSLYLNHYLPEDHKKVSERIQAIQDLFWIVSYDNVDEIKELYPGFLTKEYSFNHSAFTARRGKEVLFFSNGVKFDDIGNVNPVGYKYVVRKTFSKIIYKEPKQKL